MSGEKIYQLVMLTPGTSNRDREGKLVCDRDRVLEQAGYRGSQTFEDLADAKAAADAVFAAAPSTPGGVIVRVEKIPSHATNWEGGCVYRLPKR